MQPRFIERPEMKLVGLGAKFISIRSPDKNNMEIIPKLWDQFIEQLGRIGNKTSETNYGLVESLPESEKSHKGELFYIAAVEVKDLNSIPSGMIHRVIPAGRFACFTHKGMLNKLGQTMDFIYGTWAPKNEATLREGPHIEVYDKRFMPNSDKSEFDVLLPVQ